MLSVDEGVSKWYNIAESRLLFHCGGYRARMSDMGCGRKIGGFRCCSVVNADAHEIYGRIPKDAVIISDPPFNIGYGYDNYADRKAYEEYWDEITSIVRPPCVMIHYPEDIFKYCGWTGLHPEKVVAWVYNANTPRQWRMLAWFGTKPDFTKAGQPFKNPSDRRIKKKIADGKQARLYDWWNVNQVKNVSADKTEHPCQMPILVMDRVVKITDAELIIDPYCGSGTTLVAARDNGKHFLGFDISDKYCEIARNRILAPKQRELRSFNEAVQKLVEDGEDPDDAVELVDWNMFGFKASVVV